MSICTCAPRLLFFSALLAPAATAQQMAYLFDTPPGSDGFGWSVADVTDVDGDGFPDILVGAPREGTNGTASGAVYIYSGRTGAMIWSRVGEYPWDLFGWAVDGIGDVNGDGRGDIIVSAPLWGYNGDVTLDGGKIYILSPATDSLIRTVWSTSGSNQIGTSVCGIGDITGDGVGDWAYGAAKYDSSGLIDNGAVYIYNGALGANFVTYYGSESGAKLGFSIAAVKAAGFPGSSRILVGAPGVDNGGTDRGRVVLLSGTGVATYMVEGTLDNSWLGYAVAGLGDINNDGTEDWAISSPYADVLGAGIDAGLVRVFSGFSGNQLFSTSGIGSGARFGQSLAGIGDYNGDGVPDILIGAPSQDTGGVEDAGEARVVSGTNGATLASFVGGLRDEAGRSVSPAGDLNMDGRMDFVFGLPEAPYGAGQVQVHLTNAPLPETYCTPKVNSQGCTPQISHGGLASLSIADNFHVRASKVINQKVGIFLWGNVISSLPFNGGTLCVGPPLYRTPPQSSAGNLGGTDCSGTYDFYFSQAYMAAEGISAGDKIYAQYWSRDPAASFAVGLTDGVTFDILP